MNTIINSSQSIINSRRTRIYVISDRALLLVDGGFYILHQLEGAKCDKLRYHPTRRAHTVQVWHESFALVSIGNKIPIFPATVKEVN